MRIPIGLPRCDHQRIPHAGPTNGHRYFAQADRAEKVAGEPACATTDRDFAAEAERRPLESMPGRDCMVFGHHVRTIPEVPPSLA